MLALRNFTKGLTLTFALGMLLVASRAQNSTPAPPAIPPSLPEDHHDGLTLSADAYSDAARCKDKFGKADPFPSGILPVEIFLRNETNQPVKIDLSTVQLTVHGSEGLQNIDWLTAQEVATTIAHPKGPAAPKASRLPLPRLSGGDSKTDKLAAILQPLMFDADVLPPQSLIHGFLFFDVNRDFSVVAKSSIYVPDANTIPGSKPLLFFEVPLSQAAQP